MESCFAQPEEFIPERWTSRPELILNSKAYSTFGIGNCSCVGKNIVWSKIRLLVAAVVPKYHIKFAPGEDGKRVSRDLKDYLAPQPGQLDLVFEPRA